MSDFLTDLVWRRGGDQCEYCQLAQSRSSIPFEIDHIIARKHGGVTTPENLALACFYCNSAKGPNIAGLDPLTRELAPLFNPRTQAWSEHFEWNGPRLMAHKHRPHDDPSARHQPPRSDRPATVADCRK